MAQLVRESSMECSHPGTCRVACSSHSDGKISLGKKVTHGSGVYKSTRCLTGVAKAPTATNSHCSSHDVSKCYIHGFLIMRWTINV